ncbi:MAG: hypothetical protein SGI88_14150 [Candidatus Hydrogenedentes bacterium]|nr:hypothetical protein [Candidatus Hydrogenedentota bacterium]
MKILRALCILGFGTIAAFAQYPLANVDVDVAVLDESGEPVSGATVHCVSWYDGPRATPLQPDEQGATDAQGHVLFHDKMAGQFLARVIHGKLGGWFRINDNKDGVTFGAVTVGLGRTVSGTVTDEHGEPIAGVLVSVDGCLPATETDAQGNYAVPNIGIGYSHSFGYYKEGYAWVSENPRDDMKSVDITLKKGVDIEGVVIGPNGKPVANAIIYGANRNDPVRTDSDGKFQLFGIPIDTDLHLRANYYEQEPYFSGEAKLHIGDTVPPLVTIATAEHVPVPRETRTITGTVVRADTGKPVTARMFMGDSKHEAMSNPGATDQQGVFLIDNNVRGIHYISALPINPTLYVIGEPFEVDASQGSVAGVVLKVGDGCAIRGRAVTEDGKPVAKQYVQVTPRSQFLPQIHTRDDGRFSIPNLEAIGVPHTITISDQLRRPRSVKVGPLKKGELREGVEIVFPAPVEPHILRGTVKNPAGEPLANVKVFLSHEDASGKAHINNPVTDDAGQFEVEVVESGRVKLSASTSVYVNRDGGRYDTQQFFRVVGNDAFDLDATKDSEIAVVLEKQGMGVLQGRIIDETGKGINAQLQIVHGDEKIEHGRCDEAGYFAFHRTPEPPFIIEITKPEYQARIVAIDKATVDPETPLAITLKRGPFAIGESVWTAITGQPATGAAVEAMPLSTYVRKNEAKYYNEAKPRPAPPVNTPRPQQFFTPRVRFLDAKGTPVTQIIVQSLQSHISAQKALYAPIDSYSPKSMSNEEGIYNFIGDPVPLGYGWVAWAEGMGRVARQYVVPSQEPDAVIDIEMRPAATIELNVSDADGKPAGGVPICTANLAWDNYDNTEPSKIGVTDLDGGLVFEQLPSGAHAFSIGTFGRDLRLVTMTIEDGETKKLTTQLSTNPDDFAWLLQTWRNTIERGPILPDTIKSRISEMRAKEKLAAYVRDQINLVGGYTQDWNFRERELSLLASLAAELGDTAAVPILREAITTRADDTRNFSTPSNTGVGAMAHALVQLEGEAAIEFFEKVATDMKLDAAARQAAIEALGRIGTEASAEAFARIRDNARALPGAPAAKVSYTHAERIRETIEIVNLIITNAPNHPHTAPGSNINFGATISEDYKSADVWASFPYGGTNYKMVRIGDEWLIQEFGGTVMA